MHVCVHCVRTRAGVVKPLGCGRGSCTTKKGSLAPTQTARSTAGLSPHVQGAAKDKAGSGPQKFKVGGRCPAWLQVGGSRGVPPKASLLTGLLRPVSSVALYSAAAAGRACAPAAGRQTSAHGHAGDRRAGLCHSWLSLRAWLWLCTQAAVSRQSKCSIRSCGTATALPKLPAPALACPVCSRSAETASATRNGRMRGTGRTRCGRWAGQAARHARLRARAPSPDDTACLGTHWHVGMHATLVDLRRADAHLEAACVCACMAREPRRTAAAPPAAATSQ
jgi:hypothetical protein